MTPAAFALAEERRRHGEPPFVIMCARNGHVVIVGPHKPVTGASLVEAAKRARREVA